MRLAFTLSLLAGLLGVLYVMPRLMLDRIVFQPTRGRWLSPEQLNIQAEEVWLTSEDGVKLHGFFVPSEGASRAILFLHGNAGNASHRLPNADLLARQGAHVLVLDYRGYGLSEGRPSENGVYADARAALAHLVDDRGIPEGRIVLFGRSLGAVIGVDLAQDRPLAGVMLESVFPSASDVANSVMRLPLGVLFTGRWNAKAKIANVRAPLLFLHGDADQIVPIELGRRLFDAAPEPKDFYTIQNAGHNTTVEYGGLAYLNRITAFLNQVTPGDGP
jgi:pimeloyl-ACP methyl ester carboxylesterase